MRQRFIVWNSAVPTTGVQVGQTLSASAQKTQIQVTAPSTGQLELVGWGCSFNGSALAAGIQAELLTTATIAGGSPTSVTPTPYGDPNAPASNATGGVAPSSEGTIATVRMFDSEFVQELSGYAYQFPLGERPIVAVSQVVRVRLTTPSGVTPQALCYLIWAE